MKIGAINDVSLDESIAIKQSDLSLGDPIGKGGFGEVLIGTWFHTRVHKKTVAIKRLLAEELTANVLTEFKNEVAVHIELDHPNIVKLYGITIVQPYYMVMEFMSNGSLSSYLEKTPQTEMTWEMRFKIAEGIVAGMAYLHGRNPPIIHGDLKSLNVLLDENYTSKIADFGLSQLKFETASKALTNTSMQNGKGSLLWMAPELLGRRAKKTLQSDVYALGWTLWELAAHKAPFYEDHDKGSDILINFIKSGEREEFPNGTPQGYRVLIEACWDGAIANRPTAVAALEAMTVLIKSSAVDPSRYLLETTSVPTTTHAMKPAPSPRQNSQTAVSPYLKESTWKPAVTKSAFNAAKPNVPPSSQNQLKSTSVMPKSTSTSAVSSKTANAVDMPNRYQYFHSDAQVVSKVSNEQVNMLFDNVIRGDLEGVDKLLASDRELTNILYDFTDLSKRKFGQFTVFQYALWALDMPMWILIMHYMPKERAQEQFNGLEKQNQLAYYSFDVIAHLKYFIGEIGKWDRDTNTRIRISDENMQYVWRRQVGIAQRNVPAWLAMMWCEEGQDAVWCGNDMKRTFKRDKKHLSSWYESAKTAERGSAVAIIKSESCRQLENAKRDLIILETLQRLLLKELADLRMTLNSKPLLNSEPNSVSYLGILSQIQAKNSISISNSILDSNIIWQKALLAQPGGKQYLEGDKFIQCEQALQSLKHYHKAADLKYPPAYFMLYLIYSDFLHLQEIKDPKEWLSKLGEYRVWKEKFISAMSWYKREAERGDPISQYILGRAHLEGVGVSIDIAQGMKYILLAASQDYAVAQERMAFLCSQDTDNELAWREAYIWYKKAATFGHPLAQFKLAYCYEHGKGIESDVVQALGLYRKAGDQGLAIALDHLGEIYENGLLGVTVDNKKSFEFYQMAADKKYGLAISKIGLIYFHGQLGIGIDLRKAVIKFREAAELGMPNAMYNLAYALCTGVGIARNEGEALYWYNRAGRHGNKDAIKEAKRLLGCADDGELIMPKSDRDKSGILGDYLAEEAVCLGWKLINLNIFPNKTIKNRDQLVLKVMRSIIFNGIELVLEKKASYFMEIYRNFTAKQKHEIDALTRLGTCIKSVIERQNPLVFTPVTFPMLFREANTDESRYKLHHELLMIFASNFEGRNAIIQAIKKNQLSDMVLSIEGVKCENICEYINSLLSKEMEKELFSAAKAKYM